MTRVSFTGRWLLSRFARGHEEPSFSLLWAIDRDLKLENILLKPIEIATNDGRVGKGYVAKISDFGN